MGRMGRIPHQDDLSVMPCLVRDRGEGPPERTVGEQPVAVEVLREQPFAVGDCLLLVRALQPGPLPGLLAALDDPGGHGLLERVRMYLEQPVLVLLEDERERAQGPGRPEPGEPALPPSQLRLEMLREGLPDQAVDPVRAHDEIGAGQLRETPDVTLELQPDAELATSVVKDHEQTLA